MVKEWLVSNFEKQRRQIEAEAARPDLATNAEAIHRLRVAIKQVRALFKLFGWLAPGVFDGKAAFESLRGIFKAMGTVRDVQVLQGLLAAAAERRGEWYAGLGHLLHTRLQAAEAALPDALAAFDPGALAQLQLAMEAAVSKLEDAELLARVQHKLQKRFAKVKAALPSGAEAPEVLHKIRSWLKECLYVMDMLNKAAQEAVWPAPTMQELYATGREAGDWHDREVFEAFLRGLDAEEAPFLGQEPYNALQAELRQEVDRRSNALVERISALLQAFEVLGTGEETADEAS